MRLVTWFNEVSRDDVAIAGGKGANLGEMTRAGLPVPPGFIVTSEAYSRFLSEAAIQTEIERCLAQVNAADTGGLQRIADDIRRQISSATVPAEVASQVVRVYSELNVGPVAVRSSATAEDLAEASFAGQQSSFLNVSGDAVTNAIQSCWASLFEPQAIAYRERRGFRHMDVGIAVVVQQMVQSRRSGVMFTVHPVTGDRDRIVIEAAYGLGEAVVSGMVTPDFYAVDKASLRIEERTTYHQERELVRNASAVVGEEANAWITVAPERACQQKLSDDEIAAVAELGRRVEEHYGTPQDIEWAEEGGTLFVVQSRPVTTV